MDPFSHRFHVSSQTIGLIGNAAFRKYALRYAGIEEDLTAQLSEMGVAVADRRESPLLLFAQEEAGMQHHAKVRNDGRSVFRGWLSPACETCRKGVGTRTFSLNTRCNRDCFFCFNPNQREYGQRFDIKHDIIAEIEEVADRGEAYKDIALTGGEPLLYPDEAIAFFKRARELYPDAYMRLYTNGDFASDDVLASLGKAGLDEIRFSIKQENAREGYGSDPVIGRIVAAKRHIPHAMVEMPVLPGDAKNMEQLLSALDEAGCDGINLLELCFPFHNWPEFARRGYRVKNPPLRVPYEYGYAGGLPIDGSEDVCLDLFGFAEQAQLRMGIHYCSLENKFTSEIFIQNHPYATALPTCAFSESDFFLKSCKAFGADAKALAAAFARSGVSRSRYSLADGGRTQDAYVDFHPDLMDVAREVLPRAGIAVCYHVVEQLEGGAALRELSIDAVRACSFDREKDI